MIKSAKIAKKYKILGWREYKSNLKKIKRVYRKIQRTKHSTSKNPLKRKARKEFIHALYSQYINKVKKYIPLVKRLLKLLQSKYNVKIPPRISELISYNIKFISQIKRRVLLGHKIPHNEKIFSIFEPDTEWICKGKSSLSQELGINVCIVISENGFILNHKIMHKTTDSKIAVEIIEDTKIKYPELHSCSFDKGFHSSRNQKELANHLPVVFLPKKGKLSKERKKIEYSHDFRKAIKHHPAVESSISALNNHGLDICRDKGVKGFHRYVSLAILARNIQILGHMIQTKALKK